MQMPNSTSVVAVKNSCTTKALQACTTKNRCSLLVGKWHKGHRFKWEPSALNF